MAEIIDKNDEFNDEQLDMVRGGMPIDAISEFAHNNDMTGVLTDSQIQGLDDIYKENHDIVAQKRVRDVVFMMHADENQMPVIDVIYFTEDGMQYSPMNPTTTENDPRVISEDAGYIARKFEPQSSGYVEPIIIDPKRDSFSSDFKGHTNGISDDYIAGYKLKESVALYDGIDYNVKVDQMFEQLSGCMSACQDLDLVNKFNFRFFVNDKELVNPNKFSNFDEEMDARIRNMNVIESEFGLSLDQDESKRM